MEKILFEIVKQKENRLKKFGSACGETIPEKRRLPVIRPNLEKGVIFCEIKRSSPSEGKIKSIEDPVSLAHEYVLGGADAISVLTEQDHFSGRLRDIIEIKSVLPEIPVLRKDFLIHPDEIDISYRCGADMVLLIAAVFVDEPEGKKRFECLYRKALSLGLLPLVEIHDEREYDFVKFLQPEFIGINSRDLKTFKIDRSAPHALRERIKRGHVLFESGVHVKRDAFFPGVSDFSGLLVGTALVRSENRQDKIRELKDSFLKGKREKSQFYRKLLNGMTKKEKTLIKICGITNQKDLDLIAEEGCDIAGFILAESPRKIDIEKLRELSGRIKENMLSVAVVTPDSLEKGLEAIKEGLVDVLQVHGTDGINSGVCYYNAFNVKAKEGISEIGDPFVLYDAFESGKYGGTGKRLSEETIETIKQEKHVFGLAGGITPENVRRIIGMHSPVLLDVCSGVEREPGIKDEEKIRRFFQEIGK